MGDERSISLVSLLRSSVAQYRAKQTTLARFVSDTRSLLDGLQEVADRAWVDELSRTWWDLEIVNALMLDERRVEPTIEESGAIDAAISVLELSLNPRD